jgi:putative endonuclease
VRVKDAVGRFGEQLAAEHLTAAGLTVVDRNWRCSDGEIDLVAREGAVLVFVEVKTRSSTAFGDPAEAVTTDKAARVRRLAVRWLAARRDDATDTPWSEIRFDAVSVIRRGPSGPTVRHIRAAF